ncbi:MAG TPA: PEP-CTERM sorting domain-containing protein [Roseiarcus sp.]
MFMNSKTAVAAAALAYPFLGCAPASALVIGAPATGGNFIPFGSIAGYPEYQQLYAAADFSGPITIDDLEFFTVPDSGTGTPNPGVFTISLSTTSAQVNALSTTLSSNLGSNNTAVYDATLPAVQSGVLTIILTTPFTYNPANGNLLIDLVETTPYTGGPAFEFNGASGGLFSGGYSGQTIPVTNDSGLVTGFSTVPEPPTWAMMLLGFAGLGFAGYRASRRDISLAA